MSRNNTGNPIGSKAFADFEDNVKNLDEAVNTDDQQWVDRFGRFRLPLMEQERRFIASQDSRDDQFQSAQSSRDGQFQTDQSSREAVFSDFLQASGYQDLGEYAPGIEITAHNQYVTFGGQPYLLKPSIPVPYTTSGDWTGDDFKLIGDGSIRQDLANPGIGAAMVARGVVAVDSIADLLALPEGQRKAGLRYLVKGYHAGTDIGGGDFYWDSTSNEADNGGTVLGDYLIGRWKRPEMRVTPISYFGAVLAGDSTYAFALAAASGVPIIDIDIDIDINDAEIDVSGLEKIISNGSTVTCHPVDVKPVFVATNSSLTLDGVVFFSPQPRLLDRSLLLNAQFMKDLTITGCKFTGWRMVDESKKLSVVVASGSENVRIRNNTVNTGAFFSFLIQGCRDVWVEGNNISDVGNSGIFIWGFDTEEGFLRTESVIISKNILKNVRNHNTGTDGAIICYSNADKVIATGNHVEDFDGRGIDIDTSGNVVIANNVVIASGANTSGTILTGIRSNCRTGDRTKNDMVAITGNVVRVIDGRSMDDGIVYESGGGGGESRKCSITGNVVAFDDGSFLGRGINIRGGAREVTITGNNIEPEIRADFTKNASCKDFIISSNYCGIINLYSPRGGVSVKDNRTRGITFGIAEGFTPVFSDVTGNTIAPRFLGDTAVGLIVRGRRVNISNNSLHDSTSGIAVSGSWTESGIITGNFIQGVAADSGSIALTAACKRLLVSGNKIVRHRGSIAGSFEDGVTLENEDQIATYNGDHYKWDGDFPKICDPGSIPDGDGWHQVPIGGPSAIRLFEGAGGNVITGNDITQGGVIRDNSGELNNISGNFT